jgi:hypothetical protein
MRQKELGQGPGRHSCRGLARTGSFENVSGVGEAVLLHTDQVGVTRSHTGQWLLGSTRCRIHLLVPFVGPKPLGVLDLDGDRRSEGTPVPNTTDQGDLVDFEALAGSASVPQPTTGQLGLNVLDGDR